MNRAASYALGTAAAYLALVAALPPERTAPVRALAAASFAATLVGSRRSLSVRPRPEHPRPPAVGESGPPPGQLVRLSRIESALRFSTDSRTQYDRSLRPLLRELAAERLVSRHGIDPAADPAAARQVMGEELWQLFVESPGGPPPAVAELDRLTRQVEAL